MAKGGRLPSNEVLLEQLRNGTAQFELLPTPVPLSAPDVRFFARIGSSLGGGVSPATKKVERYAVHKITGDGRCMFRALVKGMANYKGLALSLRQEKDDADELRMAVKEIICDNETERRQYEEALIAITVDESLKQYCQRIGRSDFWGGESELLVLSKLCRQPIIVYIPEHEAKGAQNILGEQYLRRLPGDGRAMEGAFESLEGAFSRITQKTLATIRHWFYGINFAYGRRLQ